MRCYADTTTPPISSAPRPPGVARYQRAAEPLLAAIDMAGITLR